MHKTILYFTNQRYTACAIGSQLKQFGRVVRITDKRLRPDLGEYFEITYYYTS